jgi:DNA-binding CsgD family transcriptional regulator
MSLHLSDAERRHITAAQQAMLTPLAHEDLGTWMLSVNDALQKVVDADHVVAFVLNKASFNFFTHDTETDPLCKLTGVVTGYDEAGFAKFEEGALEQAHRTRRHGGAGAYHEQQLGNPRAMKQTDLYQSTFGKADIHYMMGLSTPLPSGEATVCTAFERSDANGFCEESLLKLQLLTPTFEAGVQAWQQLAGLQDVFGIVDMPLIVFDVEGGERYRSQALTTLLTTDPERTAVVSEIRRLAQALQPLRGNGIEADRIGVDLNRGTGKAVRQVQTKTSEYRICGSLLQPGTLGMEAVLVTVERQSAALPSARQLQVHYQLTPREADVALLLAKGLSNRAVADRLYISPHTARRHTEKVLDKLDLSSRSAVAITILRSTQAFS